MVYLFRIVILFFVAFLNAGLAQAERRVAFVVGNSGYQHVPELKNPFNDARGMAAKLEGLDFEVVEGLDLDLPGLRGKIKEFVSKLENADVALFFYAGHGLQVNGVNYLLPTDAQLHSQLDLDFEAVPVDLVLSAMERASKTNLVFLDACRNNPLAENLARSMGTRSTAVGRGLAKTSSGIGTLISFATQPGNVALDGKGTNSPFTTALLKHLGTPGQDITRDLVAVRRDVLQATDGRQVPWENSSLTGEIILKREAPPEPAVVEKPLPLQQDPQVVELAFWDTIKSKENAAYFETYLKRYPEGQFTDLARLRIEELNSNKAESERRQSQARNAVEIAYWQSIQNASQVALFESYLAAYPEGNYAQLARLKIELLKQEQTARRAEADKVADIKSKTAAQENRIRPDETTEVQVAALPVETPPEEPEEKALSAEQLTRGVQTELKRLGCSIGRVDGVWGRRSKAALQQVEKNTALELASLEPNPDVLDQLKELKDRACPLQCGSGQKLISGKCVAVKTDTNSQKPKSNTSSSSAKTTTTASSCPNARTTLRKMWPRAGGRNYLKGEHPCGSTLVCSRSPGAGDVWNCRWR